MDIGDRIGPFELSELLRAGAHTQVFRAVSAARGRHPPEVEVQLARPEADPDVAGALRFRYDLLRSLRDPRIPEAAGYYAGHCALAVVWTPGASLRDALRMADDGRLDLDVATALDILCELAWGLRNAHDASVGDIPVVHGMLSADCVRLTPSGEVRLLGFADPEPSHRWPRAPERAYGGLDARTDQWLLGALGVELLRHTPEVLGPARGAPVSVAFELLQQQWPAATRVLAQMLSEMPDNRFESDERVVKELLTLLRTVGGASRRAEIGAKVAQFGAAPARPEEEEEDFQRPNRPASDAFGSRVAAAVERAVAGPVSPASAPVDTVREATERAQRTLAAVWHPADPVFADAPEVLDRLDTGTWSLSAPARGPSEWAEETPEPVALDTPGESWEPREATGWVDDPPDVALGEPDGPPVEDVSAADVPAESGWVPVETLWADPPPPPPEENAAAEVDYLPALVPPDESEAQGTPDTLEVAPPLPPEVVDEPSVDAPPEAEPEPIDEPPLAPRKLRFELGEPDPEDDPVDADPVHLPGAPEPDGIFEPARPIVADPLPDRLVFLAIIACLAAAIFALATRFG